MLSAIIWISYCMFINHSTKKRRGKNTKEFMWEKNYICENNLIIDFIGLAKVMAPSLTVTQLFCIQWHLFLMINWFIHSNISECPQHSDSYNSKLYKPTLGRDVKSLYSKWRIVLSRHLISRGHWSNNYRFKWHFHNLKKNLHIQQNIPTFQGIKKSQVTHLIILYINKYYDIYVNTSQII